EIWLIYFKKTSGKTGISYEESVEEALCFGWIDGTNKGIDQETYAGRFTPRRLKSHWSDSNRERVARLLREGRMTEAGLAALPAELRQASSCHYAGTRPTINTFQIRDFYCHIAEENSLNVSV